MSRQCLCGGVFTIHQLTGEREAWTCRQCGRYEAMRAPSLQMPHSAGTGCIMSASTCGDTETDAAPSRMRSPPLDGQGVAAPGAQP
jgi:hydroxymethylpyrimidine/phosphomethylpyrimidine kinase